jgi:Tol biopolymer transport system component
MNKSLTISCLSWIISLLFLVACGAIAEKQVASPIPGIVTADVVQITQTDTGQPMVISTPTIPTETPALTQASGKSFTLEDLQTLVANNRRVYVRDGNISIEEGFAQPRQLTHSGQDYAPLLSDDGQKIVFYRGEAFDTIYSINADGSKEKSLIISQSLPLLSKGGRIESLAFVPHKHDLIFNTYLCEESKGLYAFGPCTVSLFRVDTDTGELTELAAGLSGHTGQDGNFAISPDGTYVSVAASGHIDLLIIYDGDILNYMLNYQRTRPGEFLPYQYWLPDSGGLIAIASADSSNEPGTPPQVYTIWRYSEKDLKATQLPFDPPIRRIHSTGCSFSVSPDRNWIFYTSYKESEADSTVYLGDLNNGQSQEYKWEGWCGGTDTRYLQWSPDSKYFATQGLLNDVIGSVDGTSFSVGGMFTGWIDSTHYRYTKIISEKPPVSENYVAEVGGVSILVPSVTPEK